MFDVLGYAAIRINEALESVELGDDNDIPPLIKYALQVTRGHKMRPHPKSRHFRRFLQKRHERTDGPTDGRTDGPTNGPTDGHTLL